MSSDVLLPIHRALVQEFAGSNVLAAFDYDGTLAPIAATPGRAWMRDSTRERFRWVCDCFPTVVISGREQADVGGRLEGFGVFAVIGNHGIEPWEPRAAYRRHAAAWSAALRDDLHGLPGVWIEDKRFSVAVHYRRAAEPTAARRAILRAAGVLQGARIVSGKRVVNVVPTGAPNKGAALELARVSLGCDAAIYVGDDDTDEDVFGLTPAWPLLTIRVGRRRRTKAMFHLRSQRQIDELLEVFAGTRLQPKRGIARRP